MLKYYVNSIQEKLASDKLKSMLKAFEITISHFGHLKEALIEL